MCREPAEKPVACSGNLAVPLVVGVLAMAPVWFLADAWTRFREWRAGRR